MTDRCFPCKAVARRPSGRLGPPDGHLAVSAVSRVIGPGPRPCPGLRPVRAGPRGASGAGNGSRRARGPGRVARTRQASTPGRAAHLARIWSAPVLARVPRWSSRNCAHRSGCCTRLCTRRYPAVFVCAPAHRRASPHGIGLDFASARCFVGIPCVHLPASCRGVLCLTRCRGILRGRCRRRTSSLLNSPVRSGRPRTARDLGPEEPP